MFKNIITFGCSGEEIRRLAIQPNASPAAKSRAVQKLVLGTALAGGLGLMYVKSVGKYLAHR